MIDTYLVLALLLIVIILLVVDFYKSKWFVKSQGDVTDENCSEEISTSDEKEGFRVNINNAYGNYGGYGGYGGWWGGYGGWWGGYWPYSYGGYYPYSYYPWSYSPLWWW